MYAQSEIADDAGSSGSSALSAIPQDDGRPSLHTTTLLPRITGVLTRRQLRALKSAVSRNEDVMTIVTKSYG